MRIVYFIVTIIIFFSLSSCVLSQLENIPENIVDSAYGIDSTQTTKESSKSTSIPTKTITVSATPTSTNTPIPPTSTFTPTITPTPKPLAIFSSSNLRMGVVPTTYIEDVCVYLESRWGEGKSEPGTIVAPFMFHSVAKPGREIIDSTTMSMAHFEYFMAKAKELGFSTITASELIGFLESNERIPQKSMIMILDDRRPGVTELFMPYLEDNDWTLTLAWPTTDATYEGLWERMEGLASTGRLDVQSHGHDHIYIQDYTPIEEIEEEIYKPIEVIQDHFGTIPEALIWPGGNFTAQSIQMAKEAGFKVGFSVYSNGPLMYNWIPLREEQSIFNEPLMVLPRYWSPDAEVALEHALAISEQAIAYAEEVKEEEMNFYQMYCQPKESD